MSLPIRPSDLRTALLIFPEILFVIENLFFYHFGFQHGIFPAQILADGAIVKHIRFLDDIAVEVPVDKQIVVR